MVRTTLLGGGSSSLGCKRYPCATCILKTGLRKVRKYNKTICVKLRIRFINKEKSKLINNLETTSPNLNYKKIYFKKQLTNWKFSGGWLFNNYFTNLTIHGTHAFIHFQYYLSSLHLSLGEYLTKSRFWLAIESLIKNYKLGG